MIKEIITVRKAKQTIPRAKARVILVTKNLLDTKSVLETNKSELYRANDKKQYLVKRFKNIMKQNRLRTGDWQELDIISEDIYSIDLRIAEIEMKQRALDKEIKRHERDLKRANDTLYIYYQTLNKA